MIDFIYYRVSGQWLIVNYLFLLDIHSPLNIDYSLLTIHCSPITTHYSTVTDLAKFRG